MATKRKAGKGITVDFTGVEAGGGGRLLPEDTYLFEIKEVEYIEESASSGQPYLKFILAVADGEFSGTRAWDNFSLQPQSLWKLRGLMETLGMDIVEGGMDIDPKEFEGILVKADVIHEEYQGKQKHRVNAYMPAESESIADTKASASTSSVKRKPAAAAEPAAATWSKKQKVSFMDGKKKVSGTIFDVKGDSITVQVGSDEYEVSADDLEAA